ncbi:MULTISPECIES: hypothetical protein [Streptomyces]|uniref:hypothetical protein n=1 Tax=Streptomyces TaxID=1883 RepID=UPI001673AEC4|nr:MULTISPECIES: hypothetical protein [Streptomyces]MBK3523692.1 hypothetical protein [Streptomyces sp. MBT70]GGS10007.1 hypothetical protein GCM10010236_75620 [Streptomyces eurythermus]
MNRSPADDGPDGALCMCRRGAHPARFPHTPSRVDRLGGPGSSAAILTDAPGEDLALRRLIHIHRTPAPRTTEDIP